MTIIVRIPGST